MIINKHMRLARCRIPMNIQFFAEASEEDGAGTPEAGSNGGGSSKASDEGKSEGNEGKALSFDDFLKQEGNQAEFDRRVQRSINTAVKKAEDKWKALTDEKLTEAEKLAKMTANEKAEFLEQKRQKELDKREADITKRELMATAKNTLAEKKLPIGLADILVYTNADACNASIDAVEKAFQAAVSSAVEERLKGGAPPKKAPGSSAEADLQKEIANALKGRI